MLDPDHRGVGPTADEGAGMRRKKKSGRSDYSTRRMMGGRPRIKRVPWLRGNYETAIYPGKAVMAGWGKQRSMSSRDKTFKNDWNSETIRSVQFNGGRSMDTELPTTCYRVGTSSSARGCSWCPWAGDMDKWGEGFCDLNRSSGQSIIKTWQPGVIIIRFVWF